MIGRFVSGVGERVSWVFRRTAPDPFVLAVLLTLATLGLALLLTDTSLHQAVRYWSGLESAPGRPEGSNTGVWSLLAFSMQMCLILVTGTALASAPIVDRGLERLARAPRTCAQAAAMIAAVACALAVVNWGLGLVAGAVLARKVGVSMEARGRAAHYPLLAAAGYLGLMVWHGGFSGSAPLSMTTEGGIRASLGAASTATPIPLDRTLLSPMNLVITGGLLVLCPLMAWLLSPKDASAMRQASAFGAGGAKAGHRDGGSPDDPADTVRLPSPEDRKPFLPRLLEDSPVVTVLLVAVIGWWAIDYYLPRQDGAIAWGQSGLQNLSLNAVNLSMLMLGLLLHGTPMRYARAIERGAVGCAGILLQFPLYAGIMAVMRESGMTALLATRIAEVASPTTLPVLAFLAAGVTNLFVPSGGGQWSVQGPIMLEAGGAAGVSPGVMCMAVAYGDQLTNMLQPFWALPLLGITGVKARDIVGYTSVVMAAGAAWIGLWLLVF